jgi:hypothetical protein
MINHVDYSRVQKLGGKHSMQHRLDMTDARKTPRRTCLNYAGQLSRCSYDAKRAATAVTVLNIQSNFKVTYIRVGCTSHRPAPTQTNDYSDPRPFAVYILFNSTLFVPLIRGKFI